MIRIDTKVINGESLEQYLWRLGNNREALGLTWNEIAELINKEFRSDDEALTESAYRKKYAAAKQFYDEVFNHEEFKSDDTQEKLREIERAKVALRDERISYNAQNRIEARVEQKLNYLEDKLSSIGRIEFTSNDAPQINSDNDLLVILSDTHFGQTFSSAWGEYNSDIAKHRLDEYLSEIRKIQLRHGSANVFVSIQGDLLSGSIHKSIAITNRENVVEQVKLTVEYISSFLLKLSEWFNEVYVTNVSGNHTRLDRKEDALHDERLDDLCGWMLKNLLAHIPNITIADDNIDIGLATMNIRGKEYLNCHGDYDAFSKSGISNLCMMIGHIPYAITFGHLHTCTVDDIQGVKAIRGGSLAGCGDQYTIEKRLRGKPSQMVCVCNENGVECFYSIELN